MTDASPPDAEPDYAHLWCEVRQHNDTLKTALRMLLANPTDPQAVALAKWALGEPANG